MSWCLDCHRDPAPHIRSHDKLTEMNWKQTQAELESAVMVVKDKKITPPLTCSGCHR